MRRLSAVVFLVCGCSHAGVVSDADDKSDVERLCERSEPVVLGVMQNVESDAYILIEDRRAYHIAKRRLTFSVGDIRVTRWVGGEISADLIPVFWMTEVWTEADNGASHSEPVRRPKPVYAEGDSLIWLVYGEDSRFGGRHKVWHRDLEMLGVVEQVFETQSRAKRSN